MNSTSSAEVVNLPPIFITVKQAAKMLGISDWSMYQLLDAGEVESRYQGRRRLVLVTSLHTYAAGLPTERPAS